MRSETTENATRALFWPFCSDVLQLPSAPVLFLGARLNEALLACPQVDWQMEQPFLPWARPLQDAGFAVEPRRDAHDVSMSLVLPPHQRDEARALLARALAATAVGGLVVAAAANREGGGTLESDLRALAGNTQTATKHRCRIVWSRVDPETLDVATRDAWLALDAPRRIEAGGVSFWTRPGLFAWDRIDPASALLAAHLPTQLSGRVADLGAGWGFLSMQLLRRCPAITTLDLFEANARALEPARRNLAAALDGRSTPTCTVHWHDVSLGLPDRFDAIVSNPPFHLGRADLPELGRAFIGRAAQALSANGELWLVANRHLPYETALAQGFRKVDSVTQQAGFKVIHVRHPIR